MTAKIWGICTVAWALLVITAASLSSGASNFFAEVGLLSPGTPGVAGVPVPFTSMKISLISLGILMLCGWIFAAVISFLRTATFSWQEPDQESNVDKFKAFTKGAPSHLLGQGKSDSKPKSSVDTVDKAPEKPDTKEPSEAPAADEQDEAPARPSQEPLEPKHSSQGSD